MAYKPGQWLAICDRCGMQFLSGQMKIMWNGLRVDDACFETRHPQDFVHGIPDEQGVPWTSPEGEDILINPYLYVDEGYWDHPAVVPPAGSPSEEYCTPT